MEPHSILLVEDNPDDIELALRALAKHESAYSVEVVQDGEEALWRLLEGGDLPLPDFLLLDLNLPRVDGMEVLRRLRAEDRTRQLPVIVMTGSTDDEHFLEGLSLGVDAYVRKPVDLNQVHSALRQLGLQDLFG
jgi:two-component system, response regulator